MTILRLLFMIAALVLYMLDHKTGAMWVVAFVIIFHLIDINDKIDQLLKNKDE